MYTCKKILCGFGWQVLIMSVMMMLGCNPSLLDSASSEFNEETPSKTLTADLGITQDMVNVSEEEAMVIAMEGIDSETYKATSWIFGPLKHGDVQTMGYQVTVRGQDDILLRYIDAYTGEWLFDEQHDLVNSLMELEGDSGIEDMSLYSYYTSCPSGWPLCIRRPSNIYFYSQNDPGWSGTTLGYGPSTIGSAGCLLTTYAMSLRENGRGTRTPKQLNSYAKSLGCFSGDLISAECIDRKTSLTHDYLNINDVWSTLAAGRPVIVYGYSSCMGRNHAQMIWGHDGSRYWTKDPWYDWTNQDQSMCVSTGSNSWRTFY